MVSFFLPLVLLPLVQFSNRKQEFLPMVHSCLWCCNNRLGTKDGIQVLSKVFFFFINIIICFKEEEPESICEKKQLFIDKMN